MLIPEAFNYLDKQRLSYEKYNLQNTNIIFDIHDKQKSISDITPIEFKFILDGTPFLKSTGSVIGLFNKILSVWQWGWSIGSFKFKTENYLSRKILNYAFDIDIPEDSRLSRDTMIMLKNELLNSKIYMENPTIEIEKYIAITLYLTNSSYYYKEVIENYNVNTQQNEVVGELYYILNNIEEIHN